MTIWANADADPQKLHSMQDSFPSMKQPFFQKSDATTGAENMRRLNNDKHRILPG